MTRLAADRYDRAITAFVPEYALREDDETRSQRRRLMTVRDLAADKLSHPDRHMANSIALARVMNDVAASYCYGPAANLAEAVQICRRLMVCADALDRLGGVHATN